MSGSSLSGNQSSRGRIISDINVTPLVDIMLVLLIIFMVTATYIVRNSIEVKLPEAATGSGQKISLLALVMDEKGTLSLAGKTIDEKELRLFIRRERKNDAKLEAVIAADKRVNYGLVVNIIDLIRSEGIVNFAIQVLKKSE